MVKLLGCVLKACPTMVPEPINADSGKSLPRKVAVGISVQSLADHKLIEQTFMGTYDKES